MIKIYTDGSCVNNGKYKGCGGWAYLIKSDYFEKEDYGSRLHTTNNRMEMMAILKVLECIYDVKHILDSNVIRVFCDSRVVINTLDETTDFRQKKNSDIWILINDILHKIRQAGFNIDFIWVKAHTGIKEEKYIYNAVVDKLASKGKNEMKKMVKKNMKNIKELKGRLLNDQI